MPLSRPIGHRLHEQHASDLALSRCVPTLAAHEVPEHCHVEPQFVLVERGRYASAAQGATEDGAPLLVFNPPGTVHADCFAASQTLGEARFVSLDLGFGLWGRLSQSLVLPPEPLALGGAVAQRMLGQALALAGSTDCTPLDLDGLVAELTAEVAGDFERRQGRPPRWLLQCRDALRDDALYTVGRSGLCQLAGELGVHPVYLARAFRRHFRCSPGEFARSSRLHRAAALLSRSRRSLVDVALDCGFFDQAHLARSFRAGFGMTPGDYRLRAGGSSR
ncbi:helix-turn-helix transcriptional regulator [Pelomonas sp. V22]|uniref:AraC family transcriptional regulator n=1 Tax=Pelomonas sp. V22 TaxID=2822139 RepID=UPI0024A8EA4C|nr:AraC family transcriptional regulator [Pelomonas sp. V22]MDI4634275.1 helix-turn-helix transcriptional regulator [Pelomonas sp. V22]